ncbi:MAG: VacJ family lipoprotein [Rhodospirillales bacterium]|nr:VacJ family lipoprotein [Rhodospirillales bacterium]
MKELRVSFDPILPGLRLCVVAAALAAWIVSADSPVRADEATPINTFASAEAQPLQAQPSADRQARELAQARPGQGAQSADEDVNDPLEPLNRAIFAFNEVFLDYLLGPISQVYEEVVPSLIREGIRNILFNLNTPVVLANDILQGEPQRALETLGRAVVNSTVGMGGMIDVGAELGVRRHNEDFGQTLGVWGVGEMFYVVLPLLGPSNPRDAVGKLLVDGYFDPLGLWFDNADRDAEKWARVGMKGVDEYSNVRSDLEQVKKTSIDYYAAIRSLYRQKRATEISNGRDIKLPPIPDLGSIQPDIAAPEAASATLRRVAQAPITVNPAASSAPGPSSGLPSPSAEKSAEGSNSDQISFRFVHPDFVRESDLARD